MSEGVRAWHDLSLIGRAHDVGVVRSFIDDATARGGELVITGDPGVGKSALAADAAGYAATIGARVVRAAGIEHDANVSFSGLSQVLSPLLGEVDALDDRHLSALRGALGLDASTTAANRLAISNATLQLLTRAAEARPILLVVDDMPWLDPISAQILAFLARRVSGHRIGLLATARSGERTAFDTTGLRTHELGPLSDEAARDLLDSRYPALAPRPRQRLLAEAKGNPLALLELPIALSSQSTGALAPVLPLTGRLQQVFAARIGDLPQATRDALLLAVLDGTGNLTAAGDPQTAAQALGPAVHRQLIFVDIGAAVLTFRHPLIRSAIVAQATDGERRAAHQTLAERTGDVQRRAWHLAEACTGPDEPTAALLQQVAHANLFRGDSVGAITELLRAAELSPQGTARSARLAEAAYLGAIVTGDLRDVPALLDAARRADPEHHGSLAGAVAGAYYLLNETGDVDSAHRLLTGAINALPEPGDAHNKTLIEGLYTLLMVCFFAGRAELWADFHIAVDRLRPRPPQLLSILADTFSDPARRALPMLGRLDAAIAALHKENSPARIVRTAIAGAYVDRIGDCREPLWRAVRHGRDGGAVTSAIEALFLLGNDSYFAGRWDDVQTFTTEGLDLCQTHNYLLLRWPGLFLQALVAGARGDEATSRELTQQMNSWAAPRRIGAVTHYAWHVRTLTALSRGEFDEAYRCATMVSPAGQLASHVPNALWLIMELVEAAARIGRIAQARAHVATADDARIADISPRLALTVAGARAMAADDESFGPLFERALALPDADRWPFELARIRLAYGERLRRTRAAAAARPHLQTAADIFDHLQAQPWSRRAGNELRATGAHRDPPADTEQSPALTQQQHQIAQLAATGLTNKQIGERLFLSSRTVGYHLHQIFPKLGVTSRAGLRDALDDLPTTARGDQPPP